ncbi:hypothetical protein C8R42DRAFT_661026 [Lentinula raphanica]|nr:hypothetical protein C8R42DRAFT_661026 [Lentinula raphanica]
MSCSSSHRARLLRLKARMPRTTTITSTYLLPQRHSFDCYPLSSHTISLDAIKIHRTFWKNCMRQFSSQPRHSRCMSAVNPATDHDPYLTGSESKKQSQEDRLAWALRMRHIALTQIIPAEVHLITSMDTLSISINFEFIRKALRLFLFAHDDRSQRLVRRWKQVGSDYMENRREFMELDEILGNALRQYSGDLSAVNGEVEVIKVKEGEDPVIVALRLHALRESVENTLDVARRLFVETVKEFGMKMF